MKLRKAEQIDLKQILELFKDTVTNVNSKDYNPQQLDAWKSGAEDKARWLKKIADQCFVVAENDSEITGFGSITKEGYLDTLFVHKDHQHEGIATALVEALVAFANERNLDKIITEGSITARPFFEKHGFEVIQEQVVNRKGISINNFKMRKVLK